MQRAQQVPGLATLFGSMSSQEATLLLEKELEQYGANGLFQFISDGTPVIRRNRPENAAYMHYGPSFLWDPAYTVLRVRINTSELPKEYNSHAGEELLIPVTGDVQYQFFWTEGGVRPHRVLSGRLTPGCIARVNPQIPHMGWASGATSDAWVIVRSISNTAVSVCHESDTDIFKPSRIAEHTLNSAGLYGLIASGLSEQVRCCRGTLTLEEAAQRVNLHSSYLSRIENQNVNNLCIDTLCQLSKGLSMPIKELFSSMSWHSIVEQLVPQNGSCRVVKPEPTPNHYLHAKYWVILAGERISVTSPDVMDDMTSWITLQGETVVETADKRFRQLVGPQGVLHTRTNEAINFWALADTQLLQVRYSSVCTC